MKALGLSDRCFDKFCPSLQKTDKNNLTIIQKRTCSRCGRYHSTIKSMKSHQTTCQLTESCFDGPDGSHEDEEEEGEEGELEELVYDATEFRGNIFERIEKCFGFV